MSQSALGDNNTTVEKSKRNRHCRKLVALIVFIVIHSRVPLLSNKFQAPHQNSFYVGPHSCTFRDYDYNPDRLYGITDKDYPPPFLRASFYIYGEPPILLPFSEQPTKVCGFGEGLAMDGTNPSMLSIAKLREKVSPDTPAPWSGLSESAYLVSTTFKLNHQCKYFGEDRVKKTRFEGLPGRKGKEADILIVDSMFRTIWQSHIWDVSTLGSTHPEHYAADDVRLFLHDNEIWISYKRYAGDGGFDGSFQRINRLLFGYHDSKVVAMADPTNEIEICCGRNFGALSPSDQPTLSLLTWPDPVKVQSLNTREVLSQKEHFVDLKDPKMVKSVMPNKKPSEFHGTSNQLLFVKDWNEYFGIGHLHRERKWNGNIRKDAAYGHHYTHAFFTISAQSPYHLKKLSQEFLFPSQVNQSDADVVQFASGLEWDKSNNTILIGYGINDCEGAIVRIQWELIESMLKTVEVGTQVAHTMRNMSRVEFLKRVSTSYPRI